MFEIFFIPILEVAVPIQTETKFLTELNFKIRNRNKMLETETKLKPQAKNGH